MMYILSSADEPARAGPVRKKITPSQKQAAEEARQVSKVSATQSQLIPSAQTSKRANKRVNVVSSSDKNFPFLWYLNSMT